MFWGPTFVGMISNDIHRGGVVVGTSGIRWCGPCSSLLPSSHIPSNTWYPFWSLESLKQFDMKLKSQTNFVRKMKRLTRLQLSPWKFKIDSQNRHINLKGDTFSIFIYIYTLYVEFQGCVQVGVAGFFMGLCCHENESYQRIIRSLPKTFQNC